MTYNGELNFGLLGDYDALPDIDRVRGRRAACAGRPRGPGARAAAARGRAEPPPAATGDEPSEPRRNGAQRGSRAPVA